MPDFLKVFDGTGREPRPIQVAALDWINDNWTSPLMALQLPVGCGKSAIAEAISRVTGAHIVTPSNTLVDQYCETYPAKNYLKGKEHYTCRASGMSCYDWQNVAEMKSCAGCPYTENRDRAVCGIPSFFNPISLYYAAKHRDWQRPSTIVVDEAHQLAGMINLLTGVRLRHSEFKFPSNADNEHVLVTWLDDQVERHRRLARFYKKDPAKLADILAALERLVLTRAGFLENASNYVVYVERGTYRGRPDSFLSIRPVLPPQRLVSEILGATRIILLSGTLLPHDLAGLLGDRKVAFYDAPSSIPVSQRRIAYTPAPFRVNSSTDPNLLGEHIFAAYHNAGRPNTVAHVSYSTAERLRPVLGDRALFNTSTDKTAVIERFKREGGLFIAAGCAEGLDLKDGLCRLNLIPQLLFPNLGDPVVQKRKGLADGDSWYKLETLKTTIQQAGRSTRGPDDWSKTVIMDQNFPWTFRSVKDSLPNSFKESVVWSGT